MSLENEKYIIDPAEVRSGQAIKAELLRRLASNVNRLRPIASDSPFPGSTDYPHGHDHAGYGGRPIPLYDVHRLGRLLPRYDARYCGPTTNIEESYLRVLPHMNLNSEESFVQEIADNLPLLPSGNTRNGFNLNGDGYNLATADWCCVSGFNGRYLVPHQTWEWSVEENGQTYRRTWVWSYSDMPAAPEGARTASFYRFVSQSGGCDERLRLAVPEWANKLYFIFPLQLSVEVNAYNAAVGVRQIRDCSGMFDQWLVALRISNGDASGPWEYLRPKKRDNDQPPSRRVLHMDVSALAGTEQSFGINYRHNTEADGIDPVSFEVYANPLYLCMWSQRPDTYRCESPDLYAVFTT